MKLLIFTRYPRPGRVKTRLIPVLGAEGAQRLHRQMTEHTLECLQCFAQVQICFEGGGRKLMQAWLGERLTYIPQGRGDLGRRLRRAISRAFRQGEDKVIVVGTDCPGLTASHVKEALQLLHQSDLVLGPAADGGYYLIGLNSFYKDLFKDIAWGTDRVFRQTLQKADRLGLKTLFLEKLADVDRPEDIIVWTSLKGDAL